MAKGMGNGFSVAGISISPKFKPWHGMLSTTFGGNHLACVAALAVLEVMEQQNLMENGKEVGNYLIAELRKIAAVKEVRGRDLMIGIDLPESLPNLKNDLLFKHKIFTGEAKPNIIRLLPALNLMKIQADHFLNNFKTALKG
jgi:acetylornithine/N-succinyldiaminopimelate aminotransferase